MLKAAALALVHALAACGGGDNLPADASPEQRTAALGARVYAQQCQTCHQADGQGVEGVYPPLTETDWTTGDPGRLIRLLLNGMRGPIEVKGVTYNNIMTPHGHLNDDQIAAVLTHVRSSFGNDASAVTPDQVARVRAANTQRGIWDAQELETMTGIPGE
jgi:mono/diheme cytochrome c family protein